MRTGKLNGHKGTFLTANEWKAKIKKQIEKEIEEDKQEEEGNEIHEIENESHDDYKSY